MDLFCGAGGFSLGLEAAGFDVLCAVDKWRAATDTYALNFSHSVLTLDLAATNASDLRRLAGFGNRPVDVVVGGPPCQGFSIQRIGTDHDVRNNLILEFGRLVRELEPQLFLMENVPGLLGKRGRALAALFEEDMTRSGYCVEALIVNAAEYGVPQNRRRVIYYGWKGNLQPFAFPAPTHAEENFVSAWSAISDLPSPPDDCTPSPGDGLHRRTRLSSLNKKRIQIIPPGGGMEDLPLELRVSCHKKGADRIGHRYVYGRLAPDRPAATITARFDSFTRGRFGHPQEPRNITLREGARLQSFSDDFRFTGTQEDIAALIGNAVPPQLATCIAKALLHWLSAEPRTASRRPVAPLRSAACQLSFLSGNPE